MKIQRATFLGVRGVPDMTLDLTNPRTNALHDVVVFTGPSGSGKTRVLEALIAAKEALGAYGPMTAGAPWIASGQAAKIHLTFLLNEEEQRYAGTSQPTQDGEVVFQPDRAKSEADEGLRAVLERYTHEVGQGKLEYFPSSRHTTGFAPYGGLGPAWNRIGRASKDARKYSFVVPFLRSLEFDRPRADRFLATLKALAPTLHYAPGTSPDGLPRCFSSRGGSAVTAAELSDGEADAVIFAATAALIGLDHSLVFVDRPDLHWQDAGAVLSGLAALGKDNQLFLAGRPELAAAAEGGLVVQLKG